MEKLRVTLNIDNRTYDMLEELVISKQSNKTEIIKRAVRVYKIISDIADQTGGCITVLDEYAERVKIYVV